VDETNPKVIRSSLGHFFTQPIYPCSEKELNTLLKTGKLVSLVCSNGLPLSAYIKDSPFILAVGSEAHGLSEELISITDQCLTIPLESSCESLNAAVAASIAMYAPNLQ
jgi:TrmH family RNA methyltransferase